MIDAAGWHTDLAILELSGSSLEILPDHVVVRSPREPDFHWGNCIAVTDSSTVDDAPWWLAVFERSFPDADWVAIGLPAMPTDRAAWEVAGVVTEHDEMLSSQAMPRLAPRPDGYEVRKLSGTD